MLYASYRSRYIQPIYGSCYMLTVDHVIFNLYTEPIHGSWLYASCISSYIQPIHGSCYLLPVDHVIFNLYTEPING